MALRRYMAEEIALDCREGLLTRREAMRRLGLMGLTAAAAATLLASCSGDDEAASPASTTQAGAATSDPIGTPTSTGPSKPVGQEVSFDGKRGKLQGSYSAGTGRRGAVLVIHENRGLTQHIRPSRRASPPPGTRRWPSTCCPRRAAPPPSATRGGLRPHSAPPLNPASSRTCGPVSTS